MTEQIAVHPLDIVQITDQSHRWLGALATVESVHSWGVQVECAVPHANAVPTALPNRFRWGQFVVVGVAAVSVERKFSDRRQSLETAAIVARELGRFAPGDLIDDADRWRTLMGCARVRVMGSAGFAHGDRAASPDGYRHMGVEFWTIHPSGTKDEARSIVEQFIEAARQVGTAKDPPRG